MGLEKQSSGWHCNGFFAGQRQPVTDTDPDYGEGPHDPVRIPLSWCNSAALHVDESEDSVTVSISVGDPRGAFTFTIRRVPKDADTDLAEHLIMHTPHARNRRRTWT